MTEFSPVPVQANSPSLMLPQDSSGNCQRLLKEASALSDVEREFLIRRAGRMMRLAMARYERSNCFADRGMADYWRMTMEADIRARSPAQAHRMEVAGGLV